MKKSGLAALAVAFVLAFAASSAAQTTVPQKGRSMAQQAKHDQIRTACAKEVQNVPGRDRNEARKRCVRDKEKK